MRDVTTVGNHLKTAAKIRIRMRMVNIMVPWVHRHTGRSVRRVVLQLQPGLEKKIDEKIILMKIKFVFNKMLN